MYARHSERIGSEDADRPSAEFLSAAVYRLRIGSYVAQCSCGWSAHRRLLKAAACQDVWAHAAQSGCQLRHPLIQG
jgi:hypothetical protein